MEYVSTINETAAIYENTLKFHDVSPQTDLYLGGTNKIRDLVLKAIPDADIESFANGSPVNGASPFIVYTLENMII